MKKVLLTLLAVIVIVGALAGAGSISYRIGYNDGATSSGKAPAFGRFYHMNPNLMPMHRFGNDFGQRAFPYQSPMMGRGGWFGFFSPLHFLWNIAVIGLVIWFIYWLFTKSGWRITRQNGDDTSSKSEG